MKRLTTLLTLLTLSTLLTTACMGQLPATPSDTSAVTLQPSAFPSEPSALQSLLDGLAGKYGFVTTVILAIGSLRILFKPVMLVVENALKNDPAKLDRK